MRPLTNESLWRVLSKRYQLTSEQEQQFHLYARELLEWNQNVNLTGLTNLSEIIELHFNDSLELSLHLDMHTLSSICDIGAGAGFPGIPLKIKYPHLKLYLIEVNNKKLKFLEHIVQLLSLENVQLLSLDWRTFLRTTNFSIDLFCSRAALEPEELVRVFKPSSPYNNAQLVYWAAQEWSAPKHIAPFIMQEFVYYVAGRKRRLVLFKKVERVRTENDIENTILI